MRWPEPKSVALAILLGALMLLMMAICQAAERPESGKLKPEAGKLKAEERVELVRGCLLDFVRWGAEIAARAEVGAHLRGARLGGGEDASEMREGRADASEMRPYLGAGLASAEDASEMRPYLRADATARLDKLVALYLRTSARYEVVERLRPDGVPAPVVFALHYRESSNSFARHLHEGSPLSHRTRYIPKGRLPGAEPPYRWEQSAEDAVYVCDRLQGPWWHERGADRTDPLQKVESYNGLGYRKRGMPSPYVWSGTSRYSRGKYVADGRFSPTTVDAQLGVAAILLRMEQRGIAIPFPIL